MIKWNSDYLKVINCSFILKQDLAFRAEIEVKSVEEDIANGTCFKFLPNTIHTINKSDGTYEEFMQDNILNISCKQHFPYETEYKTAVAYLFFGDATIKSRKVNMNTGYLIILGNFMYDVEIFENNFDTNFYGDYSGTEIYEDRDQFGNFYVCCWYSWQ